MKPDQPEFTERVELLAERPLVVRRRVQGQVAVITKRVVSVKQLIEVDLLHEELVIHYIDGDGSEVSGGFDEPITILLHLELPHVTKTTHVGEQVTFTKRNIDVVRQVDTSVRHEILEVVPPT